MQMSGTLTHTKDRGKAGKAEDGKGVGGWLDFWGLDGRACALYK